MYFVYQIFGIFYLFIFRDYASPVYVIISIILFILYYFIYLNSSIGALILCSFVEPGLVPSKSKRKESVSSSTIESASVEFTKMKVNIKFGKIKQLQDDLIDCIDHVFLNII